MSPEIDRAAWEAAVGELCQEQPRPPNTVTRAEFQVLIGKGRSQSTLILQRLVRAGKATISTTYIKGKPVPLYILVSPKAVEHVVDDRRTGENLGRRQRDGRKPRTRR